MKPFIPKDNQELPDNYGMKIFYNVGGDDDFNVVSHKILKESEMMEILTSSDHWYLIPTCSIKKIEFDKSFSKIVALKTETIRKSEAVLKGVANGS